MSKLIVDCNSGEILERELNKAEKDQQKVDEAKTAELNAELQIQEAAKQTILDRIGLTADEFKTILG